MSPASTPTRSDHQIEARKKGAAALQAPRRPHFEQLAHDQPQVARRRLKQVTLAYFEKAAKPRSACSTRFTDVGECPFGQFAAQTLQFLAAVPTHTPTIRFHRLVLPCRFAGPAIAMRALRFGNVSAPIHGVRQLQRAGLVIALVRYDFLDLGHAASRLQVQLRLAKWSVSQITSWLRC